MGGADMTASSAEIAVDEALKNPSETTGFPRGKALHVTVSDGISDRPLSLAWITDDLLRYTREVWSKAYGREVSEEEAIEMLVNVKRLAEVMLKVAERKGDDADEGRDMGAGLIP